MFDATFDVHVLIDAPAAVNAYDIQISYPPDVVEFVGLNDSRSLVDVWQSRPRTDVQGMIRIAGGSIKPFAGSGGELATLVFKAVRAGTFLVRVDSARVYAADGLGTEIQPETGSYSVKIQTPSRLMQAAAEGVQQTETESLPHDRMPPEIAFLELYPDPLHGGRELLSFLVTDRGSGVRETLVRSRSWLFWSDWIAVENPAEFGLGVWSVGFRAVDRAGNVVERTLYSWSMIGIRGAMLLAVLLAIMAGVRQVRKKRRNEV